MIYSQSLGILWDAAGKIMYKGGWSGNGQGKNNPDMEGVRNKGPIPRGRYTIGVPYDSRNVGPFSLPLTPHLHKALDRTHFRCHGAALDPAKQGQESDGCMIMPRDVRQAMHKSDDKILDVIE